MAAGVAGDSTGDFGLVRYEPNGALDSSFGRNGRVTTSLGGFSVVDALALQRDGKLVATGYSTKGVALARYLRDGSLDRSFGKNGVVITAVGSCDCSVAAALVLQPDGKIVVAGSGATANGDAAFLLVRYLANGMLDRSFGVGGHVTTQLDSSDGAVALVLQPDGKLVAAGSVGDVPDAGPTHIVLVRYLRNGKLDRGFGSGGVATAAIGQSSRASALALVPGGKLVVAGSSSSGRAGSYALARFLPNGSPDATFGSGGSVTARVTDGEGGINALAVQRDGKLVAAAGRRKILDFEVIRYLPKGSLDPGFGPRGTVTTRLGCCASSPAIAVEKDGRLVLAGFSLKGSHRVFTLVRYLP